MPARAARPRTARALPRAEGWEKLMAAALKLGAQKRSIHALGLREIAREAGLNPNTFYRHFEGNEDLALAMVERIGGGLQQSLRDVRLREPGTPGQVTRRTVDHFFEFARGNPDAIVVAMSELHGASPKVRAALRRLLADIARELAEDVHAMNLAPGLSAEAARELGEIVVRQVLYMALDVIESPRRRETLATQATHFVMALFAGAALLTK